MPYSLKAVIIVAAVAVVSFFAAELLIPEKGAVTAKDSADREQPQAQAVSGGGNDEDIPVVVLDNPPPIAKEAAAPVPAIGAKTVKTEPVDTKTAKAPDAKTVKIEPVDTKTAKAELAVPPQKTAAPTAQRADATKPQPAAEQPPAQKKTTSTYKIEKAALCSAIKNREPQGVTDKFSKDAPYIYYFTHIVGVRDTSVVINHVWYQNGKYVQRSVLPIKSNYWRTHSMRNLLTHKANIGDVTGQWRVDVVEQGSNKVIESASFTVE